MPSAFAFLDRTVAPPGDDRWLVPPAALATHLATGRAYAFSVFNVPPSKLLGVTAPGLELVVAWAIVGMPAAWGITPAVIRSRVLLR